MICAFCEEFDREGLGKSRIIWEDDDFVLLPTLGCFVPGYCLLMPRDHRYSFGELSYEGRLRAAEVLELARTAITDKFGPTIVAEHGSTVCDAGAGCCDHAHLHIIPCGPNRVCAAYKQVGGRPRNIEKFQDLNRASGTPYIYLSPLPNIHWLWEPAGFESQFVRKAVARELGIGDYYDWRRFKFEENISRTYSSLRNCIPSHVMDIRLCA